VKTLNEVENHEEKIISILSVIIKGKRFAENFVLQKKFLQKIDERNIFYPKIGP